MIDPDKLQEHYNKINAMLEELTAVTLLCRLCDKKFEETTQVRYVDQIKCPRWGIRLCSCCRPPVGKVIYIGIGIHGSMYYDSDGRLRDDPFIHRYVIYNKEQKHDR